LHRKGQVPSVFECIRSCQRQVLCIGEAFALVPGKPDGILGDTGTYTPSNKIDLRQICGKII